MDNTYQAKPNEREQNEQDKQNPNQKQNEQDKQNPKQDQDKNREQNR